MSLGASFDIKNIICLYFYDLRDIINLYNLDKDHQHNIIISLNNKESECIDRLNQQIIEQKKYRYVEKLCVYNNKKIKNMNHMKNTLKKLNCSYGCGIDQNGISNLNLIELDADGNEKIKNINHMKRTLKKLYCGWECGIDQNGISELNLIELHGDANKNIVNVNHMKNTLKKLYCSYGCGIDQTVYLN